MASLSGKTYQEELFSMVEKPNFDNKRSEIATFYSGKKMFITGGLGFLGRLLMEKLLRHKNGLFANKSKETARSEYLIQIIFKRLKKQQKDVEKKIILIEGDMNQLNLGLSEEDRKRIQDTNLIFRSAAFVRFMDNIRFIVNTNIRGTRDLLLLAQEMKSLEATRPSIITSTEKEPFAGWINNLYGLTGIAFGSAKGVLRTLNCNDRLICDIIPADYVVNNIIAAAWEVAQKRSILKSISPSNGKNNDLPADKEIPIYNVVSSVQRPINWATLENNLKTSV
ncbi:fatty acyl-CoA reductase 1-like [Polistes fuscatus]|uniref:fatty acyl-CoA reductase 1-like n=1 Tax=Polistes fuscatus TaxID=30207 RepID=UPI001CA7FEDB|nr:fatty acyl-CoA reductase 1-like [Polistes fuscatus]